MHMGDPTIGSQIRAESGPKPYVSETPPDKLDSGVVQKTRQEVLKTLTEKGWERGKEWWQKGITRTRPAFPGSWKERTHVIGYLQGAELMHDFDPVRFNREARLKSNDWKEYEEGASWPNEEINYAVALKKMDPERYEQEQPIRDGEIDDAFQSLSIGDLVSDSIAGRDLSIPRALKALAPERFQAFISSERFRFRDWPKVKETLAYLEAHRNADLPNTRTIELVTLRGLLQDMKPQGEPAFTMTKAEWQVLQDELWKAQDHGHAPKFFHLANAASRLEIVD